MYKAEWKLVQLVTSPSFVTWVLMDARYIFWGTFVVLSKDRLCH
jgi:hypothetical protein